MVFWCDLICLESLFKYLYFVIDVWVRCESWFGIFGWNWVCFVGWFLVGVGICWDCFYCWFVGLGYFIVCDWIKYFG